MTLTTLKMKNPLNVGEEKHKWDLIREDNVTVLEDSSKKKKSEKINHSLGESM